MIAYNGRGGTVFGLLNDLITSSISPEYFIFGKGLDPGEGLIFRAGILGMEAGFSAGAIAGAICLYASTRNNCRSPLAYRRLLGFLWRPAALAPMTALVLVLFCRQLDPAGFSILLDETLDPQQMERFLAVWWIHSGLYLGLLVSVVWIVKDIGKLRKRPQAR